MARAAVVSLSRVLRARLARFFMSLFILLTSVLLFPAPGRRKQSVARFHVSAARTAGTDRRQDIWRGERDMAESDEATEREDEETTASGDSEDGGGEKSEESEEAQKAREKEEETEAAREKMKKIEEDPPKDLEDWPDDAAKYETFGGPEGDHSYEEGAETKLGPSSLRHHEDGGVSIAGEQVDDPDKYKGEPIPGGPTDSDAPQDLTTQKIREDQGRELESEDGDSDSDSDSEGSNGSGSSSESESESESDSKAEGSAEKES